jgi:lanosterol synthase
MSKNGKVCSNKGNGVSAFEARRSKLLEQVNEAEVFGNQMVEYDYPECTTSCVTALCFSREYWPDYRKRDVENFIQQGVAWIKQDQRRDGSWYGSWGICFTYATMFALESLAAVGEHYSTSSHAKRACDFLISKQREDGGWSKSFKVRTLTLPLKVLCMKYSLTFHEAERLENIMKIQVAHW